MPKTNVKVRLIREDGNCFAILGRVKNALIKAGYSDMAKQYVEEATSSDYDNLLRVTMEYVEVD